MQKLIICIGLVLAIASCASQQPLVTINRTGGETVLPVKASDFRFEPNNITAYKGDTVVFQVENVSGSEHDFTIKDPEGRAMQSVDLPAKKTVEIKTTLSEAGTYEFFCDKPFHSTFGMKGRIEVIQGP